MNGSIEGVSQVEVLLVSKTTGKPGEAPLVKIMSVQVEYSNGIIYV
jgi:hypothetical protein